MKLYTTPSCGPCKRVKAFIQDKGYNVQFISNLNEFPEGLRQVPALEVDDQLIIGDHKIVTKLLEVSDAEEVNEEP